MRRSGHRVVGVCQAQLLGQRTRAQIGPIECAGKDAERRRYEENYDNVRGHRMTPFFTPGTSCGKLQG